MPHLRLQAVESALAARGVRDVKVTWSPAAYSATATQRARSLAAVMESYLAGRCRLVQAAGL